MVKGSNMTYFEQLTPKQQMLMSVFSTFSNNFDIEEESRLSLLPDIKERSKKERDKSSKAFRMIHKVRAMRAPKPRRRLDRPWNKRKRALLSKLERMAGLHDTSNEDRTATKYIAAEWISRIS